ncbi:hypothetical protein NDI37_19950 [Funiculus sociatus GB2-A5]|uniref:Uncharacterized protein n=1 Tax=Funiculus sociatus GB2-A5 TaxID=2933946 RepID=A0ABV0JTE1_9CYAN|nr:MULTISPECIES: hypothetical protein [unclassified Trichocoleus]MBD1905507.1 hypothetical protein [Trichocoleus sp. FACHB-832]MBD2062364.1 hypothetical protein [Trichocoleus sp. FACHB-6]
MGSDIVTSAVHRNLYKALLYTNWRISTPELFADVNNSDRYFGNNFNNP